MSIIVIISHIFVFGGDGHSDVNGPFFFFFNKLCWILCKMDMALEIIVPFHLLC